MKLFGFIGTPLASDRTRSWAAASTLKGEACSSYGRNPDRARRPGRLRGKNVGTAAACGQNYVCGFQGFGVSRFQRATIAECGPDGIGKQRFVLATRCSGRT